MSTHGTRAATSAMCLATLLLGVTGLALAAKGPPPVGGCYLGTFSGWRSGTVNSFTFEPITETISDPSTYFRFGGSGRETNGQALAGWIGDPGGIPLRGGYQMVRKSFYGRGTFRSESLNDPAAVLLSGKANSDGSTIKLSFVTQDLKVIKFRLDLETSTVILIDPPNPTVEPNKTITLTATLPNTANQVVRWTFPTGDAKGGYFENEEQTPTDNQVVFHAGFDEPRFITIQATSVENGCAIGSTVVSVLAP